MPDVRPDLPPCAGWALGPCWLPSGGGAAAAGRDALNVGPGSSPSSAKSSSGLLAADLAGLKAADLAGLKAADLAGLKAADLAGLCERVDAPTWRRGVSRPFSGLLTVPAVCEWRSSWELARSWLLAVREAPSSELAGLVVGTCGSRQVRGASERGGEGDQAAGRCVRS